MRCRAVYLPAVRPDRGRERRATLPLPMPCSPPTRRERSFPPRLARTRPPTSSPTAPAPAIPGRAQLTSGPDGAANAIALNRSYYVTTASAGPRHIAGRRLRHSYDATPQSVPAARPIRSPRESTHAPRAARRHQVRDRRDGEQHEQDDWWWIDAFRWPCRVRPLGMLRATRAISRRCTRSNLHTKTVQGGRGLYNTTEHLVARRRFESALQGPNGANCYWSRGNGWVFAALARVLEVLPSNASAASEYVRTFQDMAAARVRCRVFEGFWNVSYGSRQLRRPRAHRTRSSPTLAWGSTRPAAAREVSPVVTNAVERTRQARRPPRGALGNVQGSGKQPSDGQPVTFDSVPNFDDSDRVVSAPEARTTNSRNAAIDNIASGSG